MIVYFFFIFKLIKLIKLKSIYFISKIKYFYELFCEFLYTSLLYRKEHKLPHETHDNLGNLLIKISDNIFGTCSCLNKRSDYYKSVHDSVWWHTFVTFRNRYAITWWLQVLSWSLLVSRLVLLIRKNIESIQCWWFITMETHENITTQSTRPNDPIFYNRRFSTSVGISVSYKKWVICIYGFS